MEYLSAIFLSCDSLLSELEGQSRHEVGKNFKPEIKFFLVRFIQVYGVESPVEKRVKELKQDLGVSDHVITEAVKHFSQIGFLVTANRRGENGGIIRAISGTDKLKMALAEVLPKVGVKLKLIIDQILEPHHAVLPEYKLSVSNRLFLCVLLAHAGRSGNVTTLGMEDISRLTGMRIDRIDSQVVDLINREYIRSKIPGITYSGFFGHRPSIYSLNLRHPTFISSYLPRYTCLFIRVLFNRDNEAALIFKVARYLCQPKPLLTFDQSFDDDHLKMIGCVEDLRLVAVLFNRPHTRAAIAHLQFRLEEYAAFIVSKYWDSLKRHQSNFLTLNEGRTFRYEEEILTEELRSRIYMDILATDKKRSKNKFVASLTGELVSKRQFDLDVTVGEGLKPENLDDLLKRFTSFIFETSMRMAERLYLDLSEYGINDTKLHHVIIPTGYSENYRIRRIWIVDSYLEEHTVKETTFYCDNRVSQGGKICTENELTYKDKSEAGLATLRKRN